MSNREKMIARKKDELLFTSKHEASSFVEEYKKEGYIKKCFHARIQEYQGCYNVVPKFEPICGQSSYQFVEREGYFIGCPENCSFYQSIPRGKFKKFINDLKFKAQFLILKILKSCKWLFEWYSGLSSVVQVILALCFLVLILGNSPTYNLILELIKAIYDRAS